MLRRFVFGPRIDEPVAMVLANGDRFYHHADALGSIIALSNDSGTMTESYGYLPFGEVRADGATPYRFTGRRYDPETGVYYYRNRYYDPWQGRFISRDPLGVTVDVNLYRYVGNDPINFTDPWGLQPQWCVDPQGNKVRCPKNVCATAECVVGLPPVPSPTAPEKTCTLVCSSVGGAAACQPTAVNFGVYLGCRVAAYCTCYYICRGGSEGESPEFNGP